MKFDWLNKSIPLEQHLENDATNNFTLIRLIAAMMVVKLHSYSLTTHVKGQYDDYSFHLHQLGLPVFFFISGLLVSQSFEKSSSWKNFVWKRFLRIYPAAWLSIFACAFILGPIVTTWNITDYFSNSVFFQFLTSAFLVEIKYVLPGVFEHSLMGNPSVNSSLWTITLELKLYLLILIWGVLKTRYKNFILAVVMIVTLILGQFFRDEAEIVLSKFFHKPILLFGYLNFGVLFLAGIFCNIYKKKIIIKPWWMPAITILLLLIYLKNMLVITFFLVPLMTLYIATIKVSFFKKITPKADLSYGIYVFAFPVQQLVANYIKPQDSWTFFFLSILFVLPLAVFSWYVVEKKALQLKNIFK
ncbi:MAG: acyltransferase [Bacteroidetes bacterium]|nr:acyltransferase [Bacteroidota bacterium]